MVIIGRSYWLITFGSLRVKAGEALKDLESKARG